MLVVDDQRIIRDGLTILVGRIDGVEVVGTAGDGVEALERATAEGPDVVLMDLGMPRMEGTQATRAIRSALPETQVLVLSTMPTRVALVRAACRRARLPDEERQRRRDRAGDPRAGRRAHAPGPRDTAAARRSRLQRGLA